MLQVDLSRGIGLVLAGGGAKGAYQVGALRALMEMDMPLTSISGASIGSLNGAVIAAAPSLNVGLQRLEHLWATLGGPDALKLQNHLPHKEFFRQARLHLPDWLCNWLELAPPDKDTINDYGLFSNAELIRTLNDYCSPQALKHGLPLFASLCELRWWNTPTPAVLLAQLGLGDSQPPDFFHVQSLDESEQIRALLASAAIPLLFAPQMIEGKPYVDGGLAGWRRRQGNSPLQPLLDNGCMRAVVVHLDYDDPWLPPETEPPYVVEIRPRRESCKLMQMHAFLDFDPQHTKERIEAGYADAMAKIQDLLQLKHMP